MKCPSPYPRLEIQPEIHIEGIVGVLCFGPLAPHREILLLLEQGVTVASSSSSVGALRAAELWPYRPLSEPRVNIRELANSGSLKSHPSLQGRSFSGVSYARWHCTLQTFSHRLHYVPHITLPPGASSWLGHAFPALPFRATAAAGLNPICQHSPRIVCCHALLVEALHIDLLAENRSGCIDSLLAAEADPILATPASTLHRFAAVQRLERERPVGSRGPISHVSRCSETSNKSYSAYKKRRANGSG
ncbi:hypothetical protein C8A03DRAFT_34140 [Achaetomium macrosporum]|uniref:Uncharacterized protein n=1 Tax=Achaetomium macrosporum TaxID=79813 RepID=A0AAN7CAD6_9PEZI|nr:hypothetical protein C8A03DRAFT_34140 [Achaetomium macrosporum]